MIYSVYIDGAHDDETCTEFVDAPDFESASRKAEQLADLRFGVHGFVTDILPRTGIWIYKVGKNVEDDDGYYLDLNEVVNK